MLPVCAQRGRRLASNVKGPDCQGLTSCCREGFTIVQPDLCWDLICGGGKARTLVFRDRCTEGQCVRAGAWERLSGQRKPQ